MNDKKTEYNSAEDALSAALSMLLRSAAAPSGVCSMKGCDHTPEQKARFREALNNKRLDKTYDRLRSELQENTFNDVMHTGVPVMFLDQIKAKFEQHGFPVQVLDIGSVNHGAHIQIFLHPQVESEAPQEVPSEPATTTA